MRRGDNKSVIIETRGQAVIIKHNEIDTGGWVVEVSNGKDKVSDAIYIDNGVCFMLNEHEILIES